jgi:hypothetical protein
MKRLIPFAAIALLLAGCASTPTVYQASTGPGVAGFSEYRIEPGRYRVTFVGAPGAPAAQVNDYALLRAAELALRDGYDWFRVSDRFTEGRGDPNGSRLSLGVGGGNYGWHSGVGLGVGTSFPLGGGPRLAATLEVMMGKGARPAGADVYDARGVRGEVSART